jgi:CarD family transcriptional regulator
MAHTATTATKPGKPDPLSVGSHVFYPAHGVASVAGVESREFGSERQQFYVLELARGGKLLLPTGNVELAGVRSLVSPTAARRLMKKVRTQPDADKTGWKDRVESFTDALRGGEAEVYTAVLQQLLFRARSDKLSAAERRILETARTYFVAEIGAVLERTPAQIAEQLDAPADAESKT